MSIISDFSIPVGGLQYSQDGMSVVGTNITNAANPDYVARRAVIVNGQVQVQRQLDKILQGNLWDATSISTYSDGIKSTLTNVNALFGKPGDDTGLPKLLSKLKDDLNSLASDPTSLASRNQVLGRLNVILNSIHSISDGIADIRADTESALSAGTQELNNHLDQINKLNKQIANTPHNADLLDQRDALIKKVSEKLGVNVIEQANQTVRITTKTGTVLVDESGATKLSFDDHGRIDAQDRYNIDPAKRGVGTILITTPGGMTKDMLADGSLGSGELGSLVELRDHALVQAQGQIDDLAAGLAQIFSDHTVRSTDDATTGGQALDLSDLKSGNRIHMSYKDSAGVSHKLAFVGVTDPNSLPLPKSATLSDGEEVVGIDISGGTTGIAAAIQQAITNRGGGLAVSAGAGKSIIAVATAPASLDALSATVTDASLGAGSKGLPLFTDGSDPTKLFTDSYDGTSQRAGFASRIKLNTQIANNPALLVTWGDTDSATLNQTHSRSLRDALQNTKVPTSQQSQLGFGTDGGTITDILNQFISQQSIATNMASDNAATATVKLNYAETQYKAKSGFNMDQQLAQMMSLQVSYSANVKVLDALKSMMDTLVHI